MPTTVNLFEHGQDCRPNSPCAACRANEFLRGRLSEDDYEKFLALMLVYQSQEKESIALDELHLSARTYGCLKTAKVQTVGDIVQFSEGTFLRIPNIGRKSLNEMKEVLGKLGLAFKPE